MPERSVDYDAIADRFEWRYRVEPYVELEAFLVDFAGQARVLEVGCGTGRWLTALAAHGCDVAGIDPSQKMLDVASAQLPEAELVRGRGEALPWSDGSFDRVVCINALHHHDDPAASLAEARRVLVDGGALLVAGLDPHRRLDAWWIYDFFEGALDTDLARYPSAEDIRGWMVDAGFGSVQTVEVQHIVSRVPVAEARAGGYLDRAVTSQLSLLSDAEYAAGLRRIEAAGEELVLVSDLRIWGTVGSGTGMGTGTGTGTG